MDTTTFLAAIWGPILLVLAIGFITNRAHYTGMYRNIGANALLGATVGISAMAVGIAQVLSHTLWGTLPQAIISLLGWATMIKGATYLAFPSFVKNMSEAWADKKSTHSISGGIMLLVGVYLTWFAYFA